MIRLDEFVTIKQAAKLSGVLASALRNRHRAQNTPVCRNAISNYSLFKAGGVRLQIQQDCPACGRKTVATADSHNKRRVLR